MDDEEVGEGGLVLLDEAGEGKLGVGKQDQLLKKQSISQKQTVNRYVEISKLSL